MSKDEVCLALRCRRFLLNEYLLSILRHYQTCDTKQKQSRKETPHLRMCATNRILRQQRLVK